MLPEKAIEPIRLATVTFRLMKRKIQWNTKKHIRDRHWSRHCLVVSGYLSSVWVVGCWCWCAGSVLFVVGRRYYVVQPATGSVIEKMIHCVTVSDHTVTTTSALITTTLLRVVSQKGRIAAARGPGSVVFARWRQCAPHLIMLPWIHPSPRPKRHLDRFSRFLQGWRSWQTDRPRYAVCNNRPRSTAMPPDSTNLIFVVKKHLTSSWTIAEGPLDALSHLKSCQLLHNCTKNHIWLEGLPFHVV